MVHRLARAIRRDLGSACMSVPTFVSVGNQAREAQTTTCAVCDQQLYTTTLWNADSYQREMHAGPGVISKTEKTTDFLKLDILYLKWRNVSQATMCAPSAGPSYKAKRLVHGVPKGIQASLQAKHAARYSLGNDQARNTLVYYLDL